jgi:hypothetical protein
MDLACLDSASRLVTMLADASATGRSANSGEAAGATDDLGPIDPVTGERDRVIGDSPSRAFVLRVTRTNVAQRMTRLR